VFSEKTISFEKGEKEMTDREQNTEELNAPLSRS